MLKPEGDKKDTYTLIFSLRWDTAFGFGWSFDTMHHNNVLKGHRASANLSKGDKHIISPSTLNFSVKRGKLWFYTLHNPPEVFWKLAPSGGYTECAVVSFV